MAEEAQETIQVNNSDTNKCTGFWRETEPGQTDGFNEKRKLI